MSDDLRLALLKRLMKKHKKSCADIADLVKRKPQTVRSWRCGKYPVPAYAITILQLLLEQ